MESNNNDNYVLVLEDRTEVKNEQEAGKLSVVSGIDDKGNLKTTEATAAQSGSVLEVQQQGRTSEELHYQLPQTVQ